MRQVRRATEPRRWAAETKRLATDLVVTTMSGVVDEAFAEEVLVQLEAELDGSPTDWIPDAARVEKTEASIYKSAPGVLKRFQELGGRHVVAVISNNVVRMAAATISLASKAIGGPAVKVVGSMEEARRFLDEERRERLERERRRSR